MRSRKLPWALALALASGVLGVAGGAAAQTTDTDSRYSYRFDDDYMVGDTLATTPPLLTLPLRPRKVSLIRARASFVPEMLKSVELM